MVAITNHVLEVLFEEEIARANGAAKQMDRASRHYLRAAIAFQRAAECEEQAAAWSRDSAEMTDALAEIRCTCVLGGSSVHENNIAKTSFTDGTFVTTPLNS